MLARYRGQDRLRTRQCRGLGRWAGPLPSSCGVASGSLRALAITGIDEET